MRGEKIWAFSRAAQLVLINYSLALKSQAGRKSWHRRNAGEKDRSRRSNPVGHNEAISGGRTVHFPPLNLSFRNSSLTRKSYLSRIFRGAAAKSLPCNVKRPLKQFDYDVSLTDRFITAAQPGNGYEPVRADSREDGGGAGGERGRLGEPDGPLLSPPK